MTTNDIDAIRKLTDAATEGPWTTGADKEWSDALAPWALVINASYPMTELKEGPQGAADAEFIAAARTHVPALCDEIEQLRAELADVRAKFQDALWTASQHAATAKELRADHTSALRANTAYANENARLRSQLAEQQPVIEAAKAWVRSSPPDFGRTGDALTEAVEELTAKPEADGDDKPCCGYGCNDNLTGMPS